MVRLRLLLVNPNGLQMSPLVAMDMCCVPRMMPCSLELVQFLADNPQLNCRLTDTELSETLLDKSILDEPITIHQPDVIILDSLGRTPTTSRIFEIDTRKVHIFVSKGCPKERIQALEQVGALVTVVESVSTRKSKSTDIVIDIKKLSIDDILTKLGDFGYTSVLVEGGSAIISSFVETLNFDKVVTYIGNTIIGGNRCNTCRRRSRL